LNEPGKSLKCGVICITFIIFIKGLCRILISQWRGYRH